MSIIRAGVFGGSGYAGQDLIELISGHPRLQLVFATSNNYIGEAIPGTELAFIAPDAARLDSADVIFSGIAAQKPARLWRGGGLHAGLKVVDLSADLRLDTAEAYRAGL